MRTVRGRLRRSTDAVRRSPLIPCAFCQPVLLQSAIMEARIVLKPSGDLVRITFYDPQSGREVDTGLYARGARNVDREVARLKQQLERAGNRVTVIQS